uniref:SWIM-type domain-containing protein n=1 Tax=Spongospora subterranea TaxID=70186 RepID=A0A0H5R7V3_9EUKA|eukprot:CRZ09891.1 hypothetical protein [Spongospora subterranea]
MQNIIEAIILKWGRREGSDIDNLTMLKYLIPGNVLARALEIVDSDAIERINSKTASAYRVYGSRSTPYRCTKRCCSCPAFLHTVILNEQSHFCKHQLAAIIAEALDRINVTITVNEQAYVNLALDDSLSILPNQIINRNDRSPENKTELK